VKVKNLAGWRLRDRHPAFVFGGMMKNRLTKLCVLIAAVLSLPNAARADGDVLATHSVSSRVSGAPVTVQGSFSYPAGRQLLSLLWTPELPAGWSVALEPPGGDGALGLDDDGAIVFMSADLSQQNPVTFSFKACPPASGEGALTLSAVAEYMLDDMDNPETTRAAPDPLEVPFAVRVPGKDGILGTDDDKVIFTVPGGPLPVTFPQWGYVVVPEGADVRTGDGVPVVPTVPGGSVVLPDGTILRPNPDPNPDIEHNPRIDEETGAITVWLTFHLTEGALFENGGASVTLPQTYGAELIVPDLPPDAHPPGRIFSVWVDNGEEGAALESDAIVTEERVTQNFLSRWGNAPGDQREVGIYIVTLAPQGGLGGTDSFLVRVGDNLTNNTFTAPSQAGYSFAGYFTTKSGDGTRYFNSAMVGTNDWPLAEDTTLYARWSARSFAYKVYSPIVYLTNGVPVDRPGVFNKVDSPDPNAVIFTLVSGSDPLPGSLTVVSQGGLVGNPLLPESQQTPFPVSVVIRATDTATGEHIDVEWTIVIVSPEDIYGDWGGGVDIKGIQVKRNGDGTEVTLHYLQVHGAIRQTILGKVSLDDAQWIDLVDECDLNPSALEPSSGVIPGTVKSGSGDNFRFFRRSVLFKERPEPQP
jgi:hypothetical protein